jgi:TolB-like protein
MTKIFFAVTVALALSGCSLLSANRQVGIDNQKLGPEIRDVPLEARESKDAPLRKRVMVLPFINGGLSRSEDAGRVAREAFLRQLRRTDEFVVVANSDFPKEISAFLKAGEYDLEAMGKIAAAMGISAIIEGRILEVRARRVGDEVGLVRKIRARMNARVQIRMVNTRNGSIILNETREAEAEEATTRVAERAASDRDLADDPILIESVVTRAFQSTLQRIVNAVEKLSWEGRVALVKGERVYLNAGRLSGLQIGDILRISEEGEDVHDPETGSYIGRVPGRLKGTVEVVSYFGKDGAISVLHSGSGFRENDLVELY